MGFLRFLIMASMILSGIGFSQKSHAVNLGPFSVTLGFCEKIQQVSSILNVYTNVQWPVVGIPGISMGMVQNTSAILDFCNYVTQLAQLDTQSAIYFTGNYLNTLTDRKWEHHLTMADKTWNLANSVYDFEAGSQRQGALKSAMVHREINDYANTSFSWYNKTFNNTDARLKTRGEREADMNEFAGAANRRAILAEAINCPKPKDNKKYDQIYSSQIAPHEQKIFEFKDDLAFYKEKLLSMGPRFMNNQDDMQLYVKELEDLERQGVSYKVQTMTRSETTTKPGAVDKETGKPTPTNASLKRTYQMWTAFPFPDQFDKFQKKWAPKWKDYVTARWVGESRGFLLKLFDQGAKNDAVQDEFRDLTFECNPARVMRGVDINRQDYEKYREQEIARCYKDNQMNEKRAQNLIVQYVESYKTALFGLKSANAKIWSVESKELGIMRAMGTQATDGYQQEAVACSDVLTPAEMSKLALKQQQVNNELAQMQTKSLMKQTTLQEMAAQAEKDNIQEQNKRNAFAESKAKQSKELLQSNPAPVAIEGGI